MLDYAENWPYNHFKSIESAYRSSPFYEFYIDDIEDIIKTKHEKLIEFNNNLMDVLLKHLEIEYELKLSEKYIENMDVIDYRPVFSPKRNATKKDFSFKQEKYNQVFIEKHGFIENLSILDLLFNEVPNSMSIIINSIKKGC